MISLLDTYLSQQLAGKPATVLLILGYIALVVKAVYLYFVFLFLLICVT